MPTLFTIEEVLAESAEGPADVSINLRALDLVDADLLPVWEKLGGTAAADHNRHLNAAGTGAVGSACTLASGNRVGLVLFGAGKVSECE